MIELLNVDCMEYMAKQPDNAFDLAVVDPPYGIGSYWMKQKHTQHYGNPQWNEEMPGEEYFRHLLRVSKNQIIFGANYFISYLPATNSWIIWDKGSDVEKMNTSECEMAWTSFAIPMRKVYIPWSGARKGRETGSKCIHPCQRPIDLHNWLLNKYAKKGQRILDTHGGSFSSAIAAHYFGVDFVGCEINKDYFEKGKARFEKETRQIAFDLARV